MINSEVYIFNCRINRGSILVRRTGVNLFDYSNNADNLTELSIRTVEKMAEEIKRNPTNYVSEWEDSFMEEIKEAA